MSYETKAEKLTKFLREFFIRQKTIKKDICIAKAELETGAKPEKIEHFLSNMEKTGEITIKDNLCTHSSVKKETEKIEEILDAR